MILPRLDVTLGKGAWISLVDLTLPGLPAFDASQMRPNSVAIASGNVNEQTREIFAAEAATIVESQTKLTWLAPSRDEDGEGAVLAAEQPDIWAGAEDGPPPSLETPAPVQGGRERGLILHKLMEEVLTGETAETAEVLSDRATKLIRALGREPVADASLGLSPEELSGCVVRTLALPEIAGLRPALVAELSVYSVREEDTGLVATAGIADAVAVDGDGRPAVVIDWKSDVSPDDRVVQHYRAQVRAYLDMTGAGLGLIVLMTSGTIITVEAASQALAA